MRATGYKLAKRYLVSVEFSSVIIVFETALKFYSKYKRCQGKDGSYAYWIRHEVSPVETWDCGLVIIRQLHTAPSELRTRLQLDDITEDVLRLWTEVDFIESTNIGEQARNHREIIANQAFSIFPPSIFIWPAETEVLSVQSILGQYAEEDWVDHDDVEKLIQTSGIGVIPIEEKLRRGPGRPPLAAEDVDEWCRIVKLAKEMRMNPPKKTWKTIAHELGVSERALRYWRHDPRCS